MDFNKLIQRIKNILLTPKTEWPAIANEPATVADLYKNYIVILAAIPSIFGFIKSSLIGISVPLVGTIRIGIGVGLAQAILQYALALGLTYVIALIIDALAPTFGGQKNPVQALKTAAYTYTASWVAAIAQIVPIVGFLVVIAAAIYGIYLMYLGLPHTMKSPPERSGGYTAVIIVGAIVLGWLCALVVGLLAGGAMLTGAAVTATPITG